MMNLSTVNLTGRGWGFMIEPNNTLSRSPFNLVTNTVTFVKHGEDDCVYFTVRRHCIDEC